VIEVAAVIKTHRTLILPKASPNAQPRMKYTNHSGW
jgi:hypothetical protein